MTRIFFGIKTSFLANSFIALVLVVGSNGLAEAQETAPANVLSSGDPIVALKQTVKEKANTLAQPGDFGGMEGNDEPAAAAIDNDTATKYFNRGVDGTHAPGLNTGFVVSPKTGATIVSAIQFATANDLPDRDPIKITLEGSDDPKALEAGTTGFKLIYEGVCGLDKDPDRTNWGEVIKFTNTKPYKSYRVLITAVRAEAGTDSVQYGEVKLLGTPVPGKTK